MVISLTYRIIFAVDFGAGGGPVANTVVGRSLLLVGEAAGLAVKSLVWLSPRFRLYLA